MSIRERFGLIDSRKLIMMLLEMKEEVSELRGTVGELKAAVAEVNKNVLESLNPLTDALQEIKAALVVERAAQYSPQDTETDDQNLKLAAAVVSTDKLLGDADKAAANIESTVTHDTP